MRTLVVYSSLTGNTRMVAEAIYSAIDGEKEILSLRDNKDIDVDYFDRVIVGFWVDKGSADSLSKKFMKTLEGKEVAYFGTLGADPDSPHGDKVRERVKNLFSSTNTYLGGFLSRGKIDPKLVEKMGKFPLKLVHPLTPERLKRIEDAKPHPNEEDLENAKKYFRSILGE